MKKLGLLVMTIVFFCNFTSTIAPPKVVKDAFDKKFPSAMKVNWDKEDEQKWKVEFIHEGSKTTACFQEDGTWVKTEKEIDVANLPAAIQTAIKTSYPDWKLKEADKKESVKHGIVYEVDIKKGTHKKSVHYKVDGTLINAKHD